MDNNSNSSFELDDSNDSLAPKLDLTSPGINERSIEPKQLSLPYPSDTKGDSKQLGFSEIPLPTYLIKVNGGDSEAQFCSSDSILSCLEDHDIAISFQCRSGYCGACRARLVEGETFYVKKPIAWINNGEILPCCSIPKSNISIEIL